MLHKDQNFQNSKNIKLRAEIMGGTKRLLYVELKTDYGWEYGKDECQEG